MVNVKNQPRSSNALLEENDRLHARIKELDTFAQTVAHDIKNPIATIRGFAGLIHDYRDRLSRKEIYETADAILEESHRLEEMIDSILLFSRVSNGAEVDLEPLHMVNIITSAMIKLRTLISQSDAHISIPGTWIPAVGYTPWVEQIWMNYISNAIKYGGNPPLIELGTRLNDNGQVVFWVCDNGEGISMEQQEIIFNPFTRLHNRQADGNGLGLTIVTRIVDKLGGEVGIESVIGKGSIFSFSLPKA